jgi:hypothetical protein
MVSHYYSQWSWILTIDQDWIVGSLSSQFVKITVWVIQFLSNDLYGLTAVMTRNSEGSKLETGTDPEILASGVKIYDKYLLNKLISNKIISIF